VLHKLNSAATLSQRTTTAAPRRHMYYIGLDVHKKAISYCGLRGDERSSADKMMRMPLSKQRNKQIQRALVEAAKLAPRQSHELAVIYDRERQKGIGNWATLAVAREMVAYLLAVDRQQRDFTPAEERRTATA
jgi:transposase